MMYRQLYPYINANQKPIQKFFNMSFLWELNSKVINFKMSTQNSLSEILFISLLSLVYNLKLTHFNFNLQLINDHTTFA